MAPGDSKQFDAGCVLLLTLVTNTLECIHVLALPHDTRQTALETRLVFCLPSSPYQKIYHHCLQTLETSKAPTDPPMHPLTPLKQLQLCC